MFAAGGRGRRYHLSEFRRARSGRGQHVLREVRRGSEQEFGYACEERTLPLQPHRLTGGGAQLEEHSMFSGVSNTVEALDTAHRSVDTCE